MEGSMAETSVDERSEEIIYTSVRFSPTPPVFAKDVLRNRAPHHRSSALCNVAVALGLLTALILMAAIVRVVWGTGSSCSGCPDQWVSYSNNCYYFSPKKYDWNSSQASCSAEKSRLLIISDVKKKDLFSWMQIEPHWVGLRKNSTGWAWEDGSKLNDTKIISNSLVQRCGVLQKGAFHAASCEVLFPWICEKSLK